MGRDKTDYIIIHCSATKPSHDVDVSDVDRWHRANGWLKVGYHFFIKRDGTIQVGRDLMEGGAHAGAKYNNRSVGVCLAGGIAEGETSSNEKWASGQVGQPQSNYEPAQWASLEKLVRFLKEQFPQAKVIGHNDVAAKACPCFDAKEWWAGINGE